MTSGLTAGASAKQLGESVEETFTRLMLRHAAERPQAAALREKEFGVWQTLTWSGLATLVRELACGLADAGLMRGEHLVVIGENRPRLYAAMLAAQALGAIPVPLYQDGATSEFVFPLNNAEIGFAIVEDQEQVDKLLDVRAANSRPAASKVSSAARPGSR